MSLLAQLPRLITASVALLLPLWSNYAVAENPNEIEFAHHQISAWKLTASTELDDTNSPFPTIGELSCSIRTNGLTITLTRSGQGRVHVFGEVQIGEDVESYNILNIHHIAIDRILYKAKGIEFGHARTRFSDVDYSRYPNDDIQTSDFIGYLAFQRAGTAAWLNINGLLGELVTARRMMVSYRMFTGNDNRVLERRASISLQGLDKAVAWCTTQFTSPEAFQLHRK